jgi:2-phosphoglycerate kinase
MNYEYTADMKPPFTVLLLGGGAGTGKSTVAKQLAAKFSVPLLPLDDIWVLLKSATTRESHPQFHLLDGGHDSANNPSAAVQLFTRTSSAICRVMESVVAHHLEDGDPVIIEGAALLPTFAALTKFNGRVAKPGSVKGIFLFERSEHGLLHTLSLKRGWSNEPTEAQLGHVRMHWEFGDKVRRDASRFGLPVLDSQPLDTLSTRVSEVLSHSV